MSEPTIRPDGNPAGTGDGSPQQSETAARYRVHGSLPITMTINADSAQDAATVVVDAVAVLFSGLPGVTLTPQEYEIDAPEHVAAPEDGPARYRVPVTVRGHLDVTADDADQAPERALAAVQAYLAEHPQVHADLAWAGYDSVEPTPATTPVPDADSTPAAGTGDATESTPPAGTQADRQPGTDGDRPSGTDTGATG